MAPLKIIHKGDVLRVGYEIPVKSLQICDYIVWNNNGICRIIRKPHIENMLQHLTNLYKNPRTQMANPTSLAFFWEQTEPITDPKLQF